MFSKQREIRFFVDPKKHQNSGFWVGDTARRTVASIIFKDGDNESFDPKIFHQDGQRRPLQTFPCVQWRGYRNGFSVVGMGEEGEQIVTSQAMAINQALVDLTNEPVRMDVRDFNASITEPEHPYKGVALNMVVGRDGHRVEKVRSMSKDELKARVERSLRSNIELQADYLGIEVPHDMLIEITKVGELIPYMNEGQSFKTRAVVLNHADFQSNYALKGLWSAGNFKSRGKGVILQQGKHSRFNQKKGASSHG